MVENKFISKGFYSLSVNFWDIQLKLKKKLGEKHENTLIQTPISIFNEDRDDNPVI
jgi:hypothetical protein